jgi:phenylacetate-CoA ligase
MGPGVAQEFAATQDGPTIWEDHFVAEIIDPVTGKVVTDGAEGELVFTSLTKQAMPVVRYRTRDLTRLLPGSTTTMRRMAKISGRADDMLIIRGVNVFPSQIEEQICRCEGLSPHFELEISRPQRLDQLLVVVEARAGMAEDARHAAGTKLALRLKEIVGVTAVVRVVPLGTLPRSAGKSNHVRELRPPSA